MDLIKSVQLFLAKIISYEGVNNVSTNAKELAEKIGIVPEFEKETIGPPQESGLADTTPRQAPPKIEKAWLARIWGGFDTKYMKPLLTNSHPTLIETMPKFCGPFARLMTTAEQLTEMYYRTRDDSDADLCIADEFEGYNVMVEPSQQR
ncbi:hypothetical protein QYM36_010025, partial [Artemia franciscana]